MDKVSIVKEKAKLERENFLEKAYKLMSEGVIIFDPNRLDIRGSLKCGKGVKIDINVIIEGEVILEDDVFIAANCILKNCLIHKGVKINAFSLIEDSEVGYHSYIGPFARLRPNSKVGDNVQIGNFVEIKSSKIDSSCRINHLSFIGDTDLASNVTIGAGTITCNHDGNNINNIKINQGAYVGSGCNLVAPLLVNENATIASGSTITEEVPKENLTIARSRQVTIKGWKGPKSSR
ncbi:bifunctional protein glmU [Candidatus Thioglobus sp.]|nr:bifunctional protein glmU [Candidatus Thioglobus sp.]